MRSLFSKIYFHILGVIFVSGLVAALVIAQSWRAPFYRAWALKLAGHVADLVGKEPSDVARRARIERMARDLDVDLSYLSLEGIPVFTTSDDELPTPSRGQLVDARRGPIYERAGRRWTALAPVYQGDHGLLIGYLQAAPAKRFAPLATARPILIVALVLVVVALATRPLAKRISRPIERLIVASDRFGSGDLSVRVEASLRRRPRHGDQLTTLVDSWNRMASQVEGLVRGQRELLANISHELRSPMARMRVALELLPDDEATQKRADDLRRDLESLDRLIADVLMTSRLDAKLPVRRDPVRVSDIVDEVVSRAALDPITQGIAVERDLGALADTTLEVDSTLVRRALWNFIENAAKYGAPPITVRVTRDDHEVVFSVVDRGAGIPADERARVTEPFYQRDTARTPSDRRGVGLGLTLAQRIAEAHDGRLTISDASPQAPHGCVISLHLPLPPRE